MKRNWLLSIFSILGAFLAGGVIGSLAVEAIDIWHQPGMGFGAAFAVVIMAYISAPNYKIIFTSIIFAIGAIISWQIMEPSYLPESYKELAYQKTHIPIIATYTGAFTAYLICLVLAKKYKNA